ncbi:hypothetical protein BHE74_00051260, partial [Ensete ventricosum]
WAAATYDLAAGAAYAHRRQPCPRATVPAGGCPYKGGFGHGRPPRYRGPWPQAAAPCGQVAPARGIWSWLAAAGCPLQPAWLWVVGPAWGLAMKVLVNKTPSSTAAPLLAKIAPRKETPAAAAPGKVQKHKEEAGPVAVTTTEAQVSEVPNSWRSSSPSSAPRLAGWSRHHSNQDLRPSKPLRMVQLALGKVESSLSEEQCDIPKKARSTIAQNKETPDLNLSLEKMGRFSYEYGYRVTLAHFRQGTPSWRSRRILIPLSWRMTMCQRRWRSPLMTIIL